MSERRAAYVIVGKRSLRHPLPSPISSARCEASANSCWSDGSESTLLRTVRQIDSARLDQVLTTYATSFSTAADRSGCILTLQGEILQGFALDGKTVRGASAHGDKTHLLNLVQHGSGVTVAQIEVTTKQNEISAAPLLLRERSLSGTVTTSDALLTQRTQAQVIRACDGHYLMIVKRNQRSL